MIKVLYDDEIFSSQTTGGVSRYFAEIISHLHRIPDMSISLPLVLTANEYIRTCDLFHGAAMPSHFNFKGRRILFRLFNRPCLMRELHKRIRLMQLAPFGAIQRPQPSRDRRDRRIMPA